MNDLRHTVFLRLEGPLQAWGDNSKFVIRRCMDGPTKSGVLGLICCAMGYSRDRCVHEPIPDDALAQMAQRLVVKDPRDCKDPRRALLDLLNTLRIGVRVDRAGTRWWDYHTVGAKVGLLRADGKGIKRTGGAKDDPIETLVSRREYLCDASFLVALRGDSSLIANIAKKLEKPVWPIFLGRKSCPPSVPVLLKPRRHETWTNPMAVEGGLDAAMKAVPWHPRYDGDAPRDEHRNRRAMIERHCLIEWRAAHKDDIAPPEADVWYDSPVSFDPPVHEARLVERAPITVDVGDALQHSTPPPSRPRPDYGSHKWKTVTAPKRRGRDKDLCVFCKSPASTVHHVTYRRAGGDERDDDLRSLCRLCHDAVTMIEYGLGMGLDRINPEDTCWRDDIIAKRDEIIRFRSLETRRRRLSPEEV